MTFGVEDFHDLIRLLETRPEWRADLRRLVLSDELLALPEQIALLRADTERRFQELLEAQRRTDAQIAAMTQAIQELTADEKIYRKDIGDLKGEVLEARYQRLAPAYVGRLVRRAHVLSAAELVELLENAVEQGTLTEEEKNDALLTDVVVRGRRKEDGAPVYLAIEVSWGVGPYDVERAAYRATLLSKLGVPATPVVAGKSITPDADDISRSRHVQQLIGND